MKIFYTKISSARAQSQEKLFKLGAHKNYSKYEYSSVAPRKVLLSQETVFETTK